MPAAQAPALWLSVAATAVSAVAVAAMVMSGGPRRPLTFAGAILLPDDHHSSSQAGGQASPLNQARAPRTQPRASATPSATVSIVGQPAPIAVAIPVQRELSGISASTAPRSSTVATGAPAARPSHTPPTGVPTSPGTGSSATAQALFRALNEARNQAGLAPLSWSVNLQRSAAGHNQQMAAANELAPRVGGEPSLGVRQADQGVVGGFSAENLGYAETLELAGALGAQQQMLAEQAPDDSRRQNLLSTAVSAVGIDVLLDPAHGRIWVTEDFAQLS